MRARTRRTPKIVTGFVTSRSEPRPKLPLHGYHSIVAPWHSIWDGNVGEEKREVARFFGLGRRPL